MLVKKLIFTYTGYEHETVWMQEESKTTWTGLVPRTTRWGLDHEQSGTMDQFDMARTTYHLVGAATHNCANGARAQD